jgi:hypothetical protein
MELLTRTFRTVRRLLTPNGWFTFCIVVSLFALEVIGRYTSSDLHDALIACALGGLIAFVCHRHRATPLPWASRVARTGASLYQTAKSLTFELGIDMRGTPRIKRGYPPGVLILGAALIAWFVAVATVGGDLPQVLRTLGTQVFYLPYLAGMLLLWTLLFAGILLAFFIPVAMIHDTFVHAHNGPGRRPRQHEMAALFVYFGMAMFAGWVLPIWCLLAICVAALAVNVVTTVLPANGDVKFIWRPRESIQVRSMPWSHWISCEFFLITLAIIDLTVTACGARVLFGLPPSRQPMPLTSMLGTVLAWLAPGLLAAMVWQSVLGRLRDPARRARPVIHVRGDITPETRKHLSHLFDSRGWHAQFAPAAPGPCAARIELVSAGQSQATEFDPAWPLKVSLSDLDDGGVMSRLGRRVEIQFRRRLAAALERLFKFTARREFANGQGFWVAPHFWFIAGLTRDAQEDEIDLADSPMLSGTVGPAFHRVMPRAARHHLFQVLRALQIDLVFVEDGVKFRRFAKVLRRLFDLYDKHGDARRAEDAHFTGLPGTKVVIHEFQLDDPFKSETYPEPKYDYLGRARILHVFRDRHEDEELVEPPFDFTETPTPLART